MITVVLDAGWSLGKTGDDALRCCEGESFFASSSNAAAMVSTCIDEGTGETLLHTVEASDIACPGEYETTTLLLSCCITGALEFLTLEEEVWCTIEGLPELPSWPVNPGLTDRDLGIIGAFSSFIADDFKAEDAWAMKGMLLPGPHCVLGLFASTAFGEVGYGKTLPLSWLNAAAASDKIPLAADDKNWDAAFSCLSSCCVVRDLQFSTPEEGNCFVATAGGFKAIVICRIVEEDSSCKRDGGGVVGFEACAESKSSTVRMVWKVGDFSKGFDTVGGYPVILSEILSFSKATEPSKSSSSPSMSSHMLIVSGSPPLADVLYLGFIAAATTVGSLGRLRLTSDQGLATISAGTSKFFSFS